MVKPSRTAPRGPRCPWAATSLGLVFVLYGCANGIRLYDEPRSRLATGIKEGYANASVLSTIAVEKRNLDRLLEEELRVVRDNQQLRVDFALLRIADDSTPMAVTYTKRALPRLKELGYGSVKDARQKLIDQVAVKVRSQQLTEFGDLIKAAGRIAPPDCVVGATLPDTLEVSPSVPPQNRERALHFYGLYRTACANLLQAETATPGGLAGQAFTVWLSAVAEVAALDRQIDDAQKDVAGKTEARDKAAKAAADAATTGAATTKDLQEKAAAAEKTLQDAKSFADLIVGKENAKKHVDALVVLLTAAAGGKIDTKDPQVATAAAVAGSIPSLTGELKELVDRGRAPSVNNLLIELRHQVVLLERARLLRSFAQQRADLAHAQYEAMRAEAELWVRFADAMCSYASVVAGKGWPAQKCDNFTIDPGDPNASPPKLMTCMLADPAIPTNCVLVTQRWNEVIRSPGKDDAPRELYKGLAAYLQALAAGGTQHELTFRLIDVRHREALVTREAALRGWDNLVAVPVDQLDAYYRAGLKPAEIADLIVKALGFAAIAFGVSQ